MASFIEQATLKVNDQASAEIKKINSALRSLFKTASKLKSTTANIDIKTKGLAQATSMIKGLARDARALKATTGSLRINLNASAAQRQLAQLRAQARLPITMNVRAVGAGGRGAAAAARNGMVGRTVGRGADYLRSELTHELFRAVKDGVNDSTMGESSLKLKQLDRIMGAGTEAAARRAIADIGREKAGMTGGALLSAGQRAGLFSEALGVTNLNVEAARGLTSGMEELIRSGVILGQSFDDAREAAINYGKAAEMMGRTTFHDQAEAAKAGKKVGDFDEKKTRETFEYFQKLQPEIGKEMTGTFTKQIAKYLGSARFAMSDRAIGAVMMLGEEEGTRAAVGFRQATKQLSGQGLKKQQLKNLIEAGLVNTEEVKKESRKGRITTTTEATGAKDRKMLATDLPQYVAKYIAPQAERFKLDISKPEDAVALAQKYVSDTTAVETIAALLYRSKEIQQKLDTVDKRQQGAEVVRRLTAQDVRATMTGLSNQLQSVTGEAVMATAPIFTPILQGLSAQMQTLGETVKAASAGDKEAQAKIATGALATAVLGAPAAKMATQVLAPLAKPLGLISSLAAMTSADPAVRGLGSAGLALQQAAGELSAAAGALGGKGPIPDIGGAPEKPGGAKPPAEAPKKAGWGRQMLKALQVASVFARRAGPVIGGGALIADLALTPPAEAKKNRDALKAAEDLKQAKRDLLNTNIELGITERALAQAQTDAAKKSLQDQVNALIKKRDDLKAQIEGQSKTAEPTAAPKPQWLDDAVKMMKDYQAAPTKFPPPEKTSAAEEVQTAANTLQTTTSAFSTSFLQGTSALQSTAATFPQVFNTGAATIGQSGNTIVSTLSGAAPGIGAIIGNAAAAAIAASVSNLSINVNANVTGAKNASADKGGQSPD
ncbi:hypothetical protein [Bradyrhizobium sp. USDA 4508]